MKQNLKTFPTGRGVIKYQYWKIEFEKELRDRQKIAADHDVPYSTKLLLKEILGE